MKFGYRHDWTLPMVISAATEKLLSKAWLIVALDSNRGERLRQSYGYLKEKLPEYAKWTGSGIRFQGHDLSALVRESGILVPFSAAYVVDEDASELPTPYSLTSESQTFESTLPIHLQESFSHPGVHAYFADGCGLNYCLSDAFIATINEADALG
jgi:hypothetical protein